MAAIGEDLAQALIRALRRALRPFVRVLIRYGVGYRAFVTVAKQVYVSVAAEEFRIANRHHSISRIAILTGLPRKDVAQTLKEGTGDLAARPGENHGRIARILSGWRHDHRFLDSRGRPSALPFAGRGASFSKLVRRYGADVPARAALDEMLRMEAVRKRKDGYLLLVAETFVPADLELDKLDILGADVADLVAAIDHNLVAEPAERFVQRKSTYDNVPRQDAVKLHKLATKYAERFIARIDALFAKHDRDVNPSLKGTDRERVVVGVWYFAEDYKAESDDRGALEEDSE